MQPPPGFNYLSTMKKLLILTLFCPLYLFAQDTTKRECKLLRETDPFTKEIKLSTGFIKLKGGSVTIDANKYEVDVLFTIEGEEKCFDNNSTAWIFYEGVKTKMTMRNGGTMNCEGLFHFIFKNSPSTPTILQRLMTMGTNHITFTGNNKKESTIEIKLEDQEKFMNRVACLVEEAKKLL